MVSRRTIKEHCCAPRAVVVQAVDMFLAIVGAEAGAMALRCLARGGVFIAGGIVPRLLDRVTKTGVLRDAFINRTARERFQYLLRSMPLYVVTNTRVGIIGSRCGKVAVVLILRGKVCSDW